MELRRTVRNCGWGKLLWSFIASDCGAMVPSGAVSWQFPDSAGRLPTTLALGFWAPPSFSFPLSSSPSLLLLPPGPARSDCELCVFSWGAASSWKEGNWNRRQLSKGKEMMKTGKKEEAPPLCQPAKLDAHALTNLSLPPASRFLPIITSLPPSFPSSLLLFSSTEQLLIFPQSRGHPLQTLQQSRDIVVVGQRAIKAARSVSLAPYQCPKTFVEMFSIQSTFSRFIQSTLLS